MNIRYPCRCQIVDVAGCEVYPGVIAKTPAVSKPHVGEHGLADRAEGNVRIILDSGAILWGYECWWIPEIEAPETTEPPAKEPKA